MQDTQRDGDPLRDLTRYVRRVAGWEADAQLDCNGSDPVQPVLSRRGGMSGNVEPSGTPSKQDPRDSPSSTCARIDK